MEIKIGNKFLLTTDDRQYTIKEKKKVQKKTKNSEVGDIYWVDLGYYTSLENAFNYLLELKVRRSDVTTLEELKDEYVRTREWLNQMFKGVGE